MHPERMHAIHVNGYNVQYMHEIFCVITLGPLKTMVCFLFYRLSNARTLWNLVTY